MKSSWIIGIMVLYVALAIISGMVEMTTPLGVDEVSRIKVLMSPTAPAYTDPLGAIFAYITFTWDYIANLWGIFWFDYAFFSGGWVYVRYLLFIPVSIGVIVSLVIAVVRGAGGS